MHVPIWIACGSFVLLTFALVLRQETRSRRAIPSWLASGLIGLSIGSGLSGTLLAAVGRHEPPPAWDRVYIEPEGFSSYLPSPASGFSAPADPLQPGTPFPELVAAGWVNGYSPAAADLRGKVVVVDVWADW